PSESGAILSPQGSGFLSSADSMTGISSGRLHTPVSPAPSPSVPPSLTQCPPLPHPPVLPLEESCPHPPPLTQLMLFSHGNQPAVAASAATTPPLPAEEQGI
ncbi:Disintegrin and metalloproteinase domain containing protein 29, partial [Dissostichus eleginoides]